MFGNVYPIHSFGCALIGIAAGYPACSFNNKFFLSLEMCLPGVEHTWFCVANIAICHTQSCTYMYVIMSVAEQFWTLHKWNGQKHMIMDVSVSCPGNKQQITDPQTEQHTCMFLAHVARLVMPCKITLSCGHVAVFCHDKNIPSMKNFHFLHGLRDRE